MRVGAKALLFVVFAMTGFSALTLQVVWQRVLSLHAGVDLVSFTTVVAAFLAGIGIGSLAGGVLADRLGRRGSVLAFAASNLTIGAFCWISLWVFYDLYEAQAANLGSPWTKFAFNLVLLLVPTTLMGLSLPLVAKGMVARVDEAASLIGRLYAANTMGAAAGAAVAGWILLGTVGFESTVRLAGSLNVLAAVAIVAIHQLMPTGPDAGGREAAADVAGEPAAAGASGGAGSRAWPWYVVYALTGAVALGFETVFFRLIDSSMRSNSYSFAHVLSLYLLLFGAGAALASPIVRRVRRPDLWFLGIQFGIGVTALVGVILLARGLPRSPFAEEARGYFASEGFVSGFRTPDGSLRTDILPVFLGIPLLVMGVPVLGMGAAYPFVQALVAQRMSSLGRHTGRLMFANVVGNVTGTLLIGFVLIDRLGVSGTYRVLGLALLVPGLVAARLAGGRVPRQLVIGFAAIVVMLLVVRVLPSNDYLYTKLHGVDAGQLHLAEDRSCVNALRTMADGSEEMTVNAAPQNGYPFDQFHLVLGLTASLLHEDPSSVMALGLGIGATPYGVSLDQRVDRVETVEICGPQVPLLRDLGERRSPELRAMFADPRVNLRVGDGRDFLLRTDERFDVVVVDTLRPQSAFSGNLYSKEFYELVRDRLTDDGLLAQWVPTHRVLNTALEVFPHVAQFDTPGYQGSSFFVASKAPIDVDAATMVERLGAIPDSSGLTPESRAEVTGFFGALTPRCVYRPRSEGGWQDGQEALVNRDLFARDEYFLNQPPDVPLVHACTPP